MDKLRKLEQAVSKSTAVACRSFGEAYRLAYSDSEIYSTYYQRLEAGLKLPEGSKWDKLRPLAETILFGETNKRHVQFAALTLNGEGATTYGECSMLMNDEMISHRASVLEKNGVFFMQENDVRAGNDYSFPPGFRAPWKNRDKVAVTKLASRITAKTSASTFPGLILKVGKDTSEDDFIEVHVWGSLTIRSFEKIRIRKWRDRPSAAELNAFKQKLRAFNVKLSLP